MQEQVLTLLTRRLMTLSDLKRGTRDPYVDISNYTFFFFFLIQTKISSTGSKGHYPPLDGSHNDWCVYLRWSPWGFSACAASLPERLSVRQRASARA